MKITIFEIYLFRFAQGAALPLSLLFYFTAWIIRGIFGVIFCTLLLFLGIFLIPFLFALMVLDLASDFSRSYTNSFGGYIDGVLFLPETLWEFFVKTSGKAFHLARAVRSFATE